ncbi:MAG TPA: methyltransferase, partial [Flavobacteriaceae bacterium]|nr:methyltransferase [Flavobacteriaceae bacterium]
IGLMMAQRSSAETIDAVEVEDTAYIQCVDNFEQCDWGNRLFCYHASFQEFANEMDEKYDLIISNPPFYNTTNLSSSKNKSIAKHTQQLNFEELLNGVDKLLSHQGNCAFIIPYAEEEYFLKLAANLKLYPKKITHVKGHKNAPYKRSLLQLSYINKQPIINDLIIEIERHVYTNEYKSLVKDFYLNM